MKRFSEGFLVVAVALGVQLSLNSIANAKPIKENNTNSKIFSEEDKENKDPEVQNSKESNATKAPNKGNTQKQGGNTQSPGGSTQSPGGSTQNPGGGTKNPGGGTQNPGGGTQNPGGNTQNPGGNTQNPGGGTKNPGGNTQNPGGNTQNPGGNTQNSGGNTQNQGGSTQNPGGSTQNEKDRNIPKLMKVNQISPNQIEISYDRDVDVDLGTKATNYWIQDTMNDKAKGIASLGKNDKVDSRNSLVDDKIRIEAKEDSQRTFVLTFSKDIPKGSEYKLIISNVTVEGASPYSGENGMMIFVGK